MENKKKSSETVFPKIALSSKYSNNPHALLQFAKTKGLEGIEYSISSESAAHLRVEYSTMKKLAASELEIRYHLPFKEIELAHEDPAHAEKSLKYIKECIDMVSVLGGVHVVVHLGLGYQDALHKLSLKNAFKYLEQVVVYGRQKEVTVCLENLTFGFTSTPEGFKKLLEKTGAMATVDIGHVVSSPVVEDGKVSPEEFILAVAPFIRGAHVYDKEINEHPYHLPPREEAALQSRLQTLMKTDANWWLIELGEPGEILLTASYARNILSLNQTKIYRRRTNEK